MSNLMQKYHEAGQSLWLDYIERRLLENGELEAMIARSEICGMTSNPSIFHQAIANSNAYDPALVPMAWAGYSGSQIFEELVQEDIRLAADLFRPLYESTTGEDGYISLEVSPFLTYDTDQTLVEVMRLWQTVDRPNLMIKIPATQQGISAIRKSIAAGINVNITLIFSLTRYAEVMESYLGGLEDRLAEGKPIDRVASVASFFVSRIDTKVDRLLEAVLQQEGSTAGKASALRGKIAVAGARLAYQQFCKTFSSERFSRLQAHGARVQRPLWASTGTKNPAYPDTKYVDELIGPRTVNTVPPHTLAAWMDHGKSSVSIEDNLEEAREAFSQLTELGISIDQVTQELEEEGVKAFAKAFSAMLETIEERRSAALAGLGSLAAPVARRVARLAEEDFPERLNAFDPTLWTMDPDGQAEIRKRLGWLSLPGSTRAQVSEYEDFAREVLVEGFTHALLLGMGGSSLAPEVLRLVFGKPLSKDGNPAGLDLHILDSTDPRQVRAAARRSPVRRTLYLVSSKSGGTAEVNAFLDYFWHRTCQVVGEEAGRHFIAITDPGTSLEKLAIEHGFRRVFLADPSVGGRYSALSAFGLVPAALLGVDVNKMLGRAVWMRRQCDPGGLAGRNPGLVLGAIMGEAALHGRDKLSVLADPVLSPLGAWLEQLIAESSGKQGVGIVPVDGEPLAAPGNYGFDRLFVYLRCTGDQDLIASQLQMAGHPVLVFDIPNPYDLGSEFFRWQVGTAVACSILGVNAFDQPDVQDSKTRTVDKIMQYRQRNRLEEGKVIWKGEGVLVYGMELPGVSLATNLKEVMAFFLRQAQPGEYVAINAYLPRSRHIGTQLTRLRKAILERTRLATTLGFGPRFLHSTGQLHKGGADNGIFLQITADPTVDLTIPGQDLTFSTLERAQALGDLEALLARSRRVIHIHLAHPEDVTQLLDALS